MTPVDRDLKQDPESIHDEPNQRRLGHDVVYLPNGA